MRQDKEFPRRIRKLMSMVKEEESSILVIRSAPLYRIFNATKRIREEYPRAKISILVQPEAKDEIERSGLINKVILGRSGRISIFRSIPLILRLRRERFDLGVIIYNTTDIEWHRNLKRFLKLIGVKKMIGVTVYNEFQPFTVSLTKELLSIVLKWTIPLLVVIILVPLIIILMIIFTPPYFLFRYLGRGIRRFKNKRLTKCRDSIYRTLK